MAAVSSTRRAATQPTKLSGGKMRKTFLLSAVIALCLISLLSAGTPSSHTSARAARKNDKLHKKGAKAIPGDYIVVLDNVATGEPGEFSQAEQVRDVLVAAYGGRVKKTYKHALNGYAAEMTEAKAEALSLDPRVQFVEEDQVYTADATQTGATWGLDRIDQRDRPLNGTYVYNHTGSGVRAYIIDTGIRTSHTQFGGRAAVSADFVGDGRNGQDCNGHGTHVAGTIGGSTYGVAKSVSLRAVRVLNCQGSGTTSGVISGVNWVASNRVLPAVANMSLGGGASSALDTAVNNAINAGVTFAVAAGNSNANACNYSPARVAAAITVTSMASPHVAGVAALYLQGHTGSSNATVRNALVNGSTTNVLTGVGTGSPNRLLYSL